MGKKVKTAATPDYMGLAKQESAANKQNLADQLRANRPTQVSTEGQVGWSQDPTTGEWTQTSTLNAPQQQLYDTQLGNQQGIADKSGQMLQNFNPDYSGIPKMGEVGQFNQQATDLYNQLAQPGLDRQVNSQRARAAAMGIPEFGSRAGDNMNQQLGDLTSRSGMMGAQAGIHQGNIMFDQQNQLHRQGYQDINNQLGNIQGLMGLGRQQSANPTFNPFASAGMAQTPNLTGAANQQYQAEQAKLNAQAASRGGLLSTIGNVAGMALGGPIGGMIGSGIGGLFGGGGNTGSATTTPYTGTGYGYQVPSYWG